MHAAFYDRQGPAHDVLHLGELPTPHPGPGEVRVRVYASAVNPSDTKARGAWGGAPMPFPRVIPHQDGAGVAPNGVISAYASTSPDAAAALPVRRTMMQNAVVRTVFVYGMGAQAHADAVRDVTACLAAGAYRPLIGLRLPLGRVAAGHDAQDSGATVGKVVFDVA